MTIRNNTEEFDRKDRAAGAGRIVAVVLLGLIVLVTFILYRESAGGWPGKLLNRPAVTQYLKKNYPGESGFTVRYSHFDPARGRYVYDCSCDSGNFLVEASRFRVRRDGYRHDFLCDTELEKYILSKLGEYLDEHYDSRGAAVGLSFDIMIPESEVRDGSIAYGADDPIVESMGSVAAGGLVKYGGTARIRVSLYGGEITFSEYKELVYGLLTAFRGTLYREPDYFQVFYYRKADGDDPDAPAVWTYESHMPGYVFSYGHDGFMKASGINFYVEPGEEQRASLRRYTLIQIITVSCIALLIIAAVISGIFRRRRFKKPEKA